tara:strand:+ start:4757 stop:4996 length:240 start_codon:yes stop_codon:yes gene_type:complete
MNLFDAVPTVVKNNFWGYDVDDSISTKEVSNAVYEVIDLCDNFDRDTIQLTTFKQVRLMVSNAIDLMLDDPNTFNEVMF